MTLDLVLRYVFANQWMVFLVSTGLLVAAAELGFRSGLQLFHARDGARSKQIGAVQGAILGLLGLLLGFTFAMAAARYETRRGLVLLEANAIGTTSLRAEFLPEPIRKQVAGLLQRYVVARLAFYDAGTNEENVDLAEQQTAEIQRELWAQAVLAADSPTPLTVAFVDALNETIDLDATRLDAYRARVPSAVWLLLLIVASAGCYVSGESAGADGARTRLSGLLLPLLIAVVITLVSDLDRPRQGVIGISQQPLLDVQAGLEKDKQKT